MRRGIAYPLWKKYEDMRKRWHKPRPAADQENESFSLQCVVHKLYSIYNFRTKRDQLQENELFSNQGNFYADILFIIFI
jgi:hypothetical protein